MASSQKPFSRRYLAVLTVTLVAVVCFFLFKPSARHTFRLSGVVWTTDYHITYHGTTNLSDSVQAVLNAVDMSASVYNEQSLISAINAGGNEPLDACLMQLYKASQEVHKASAGAFDPTVMPLVNAWGFGYKNGQLPTQAQIDSILQFVGLEKTHLEQGRIVKQDPRTQFDFSSIAKGYACDEIGRMLERNGVENYMVEIGGEVALKGVSPRGDKWNVSVDMPQSDPDGTHHESAMTLSLDKGGVATSGNYRKFKEVNGKRISHIVNPKTGKSEESTLLSVTVTAPNCMLADAWATACMAMGTEKAKALMEKENKMGVMTIATTPNGSYEVWSNKAFASQVAR